MPFRKFSMRLSTKFLRPRVEFSGELAELTVTQRTDELGWRRFSLSLLRLGAHWGTVHDSNGPSVKDFLFLMHVDTTEDSSEGWPEYISALSGAGAFQGGSSMGSGVCIRRTGEPGPLGDHLTGYIKVKARDLDHALELVRGNPVYEAGGTVEVRELPEE